MSDEDAAAIETAWAYERLHVGALFRQWTGPVLDAAGVSTGDRVLDVACGTGVLARAARDRVGAAGSVTGLDIGRGMLEVAEAIEPDITWVEGNATTLPFEDDEFDAVISQFGLMFFADRVQALREMLRCVKPGRRVAVAVWGSLDDADAYPITVDLFHRHLGPAAADALRAPFALGDVDELRDLFDEAGASQASIVTTRGRARFPSARAMVEADLYGWLDVMGVDLGDGDVERILTEADRALDPYVTSGGEMTFDIPAHVVSVDT